MTSGTDETSMEGRLMETIDVYTIDDESIKIELYLNNHGYYAVSLTANGKTQLIGHGQNKGKCRVAFDAAVLTAATIAG
jgi:hypothetical protein